MQWEKHSVLVTGYSGLLGAHVGKYLLKKGAKVVGMHLDNKAQTYGKIEKIDDLITLCQCNINDYDRLSEIITNHEIEFIFHCAAHSIVRQCVKNPIGAFNTNIIGTANLLEVARNIGGIKGIMCMESDKSYGSFESNLLPYKETDSINPKNVYEVSKACAGLVAQSYFHNYGLPVFNVRAANLYGPGDMNLSRLIPGTILRLLKDESPILYSGVSDYVREFLYVEDASSSIIKIMEKIKITRGEIYNLGSGSVYKIFELINLITKKINKNIKVNIIQKDVLFKEIEEQYLDYNKLKLIIDDYNPISMDNGLDLTIEWYKKHSNILPNPNLT